MAAELDEHILEQLYSWIDSIPLTRQKKDLKRDFSDGGIWNVYTKRSAVENYKKIWMCIVNRICYRPVINRTESELSNLRFTLNSAIVSVIKHHLGLQVYQSDRYCWCHKAQAENFHVEIAVL